MRQENKTIQAKYKARMKSLGFKLIAVWVHDEDVEKIKGIVRKLKDMREQKKNK